MTGAAMNPPAPVLGRPAAVSIRPATAPAGPAVAAAGPALAATGPDDLLGLADAILDGTVALPDGSAARGAAVLARQVLEAAVQHRCAELVGPTTRPTFRSQLVLLRRLGDPAWAERATLAWEGLSRACHHHAYELQPTVSEVRVLVGLVRDVTRAGGHR